MNLKPVLILLLLVFLPIAMAAGLEVDDIKGYVNDERVSDIDKEGDGEFNVQPGDIIDLIVSLRNPNNTTTLGKLVGKIENINDGDDITKTQDFYDIDVGDSRAKTLSFSVPNDAREDRYDFELKISFKYGNGTEGTVKELDYDVVVKKEEEQQEQSISSILSNFTSSCNSIIQTTNTCFDYIGRSNNCSIELSTVKEERGSFKTKSEDCSSSLDTCSSDKAELEREKTALNNRISEMVTTAYCNNQTAMAIIGENERVDDKNNKTLGFGALAALAYWYYNKRKKEKSSVEMSYQSDYYGKG